ncbi:cation transport ATPase [Onion yellows phytoplasma OY-M]|uniref:Cation transport ATPase n=2 Tax=16SrI (Aster yellows group) TaxID=3042590 RepID=Q6YR32_ONYPE|nr:cation transport ATPase [Onion yellows phytoplasma OY-M]
MKHSFSQKNPEQSQALLQTKITKGLTSQEALQRLQINGKNQIQSLTKPTFWHQFQQQFKDFLVIVLLLAATINFVIGILQGNKEELLEGCFILIIVLLNAFLSIYYETKTQKVLANVSKKASLNAKVIRDSKPLLIPMQNLVIGDIVILETGDIIPADMILLETFNLYVDESLFTGESQAVLKSACVCVQNAALTNQNMAFMNTVILKGRAKGVVFASGMQTEIGKITQFISQPQQEKTPLEQNIAKLTKKLTLIIGIIIFLNGLWTIFKNIYSSTFSSHILKHTFLDAIALAVAAIPESLLIIMTLILALGMKKLALKKAIVKNLKTLETLGAVNVICTDKTGTLTQNNMTVKKIIVCNSLEKISPFCVENINEPKPFNLEKLLLFGILCNDALISVAKTTNDKTSNNLEIIADPTEKAFINLALFYQYDAFLLQKKYPRFAEIAFDSQRKLMTTFHHKDGFIYAITKGAPEVLLQKCSQVQYQEQTIAKDTKIIKILEKQISQLSEQSLRVLGVAYRVFSLDLETILKNNPDIFEQDLIFLGAVAMEDPIRKEVMQAIFKCNQARVTPIMITGDHLKTAFVIAKKLNILSKPQDLAITGDELAQMPEEEFLEKLLQIKVYARTNPHHKLKIVKAWQKKGFVVAMTGDGINDSLSIKQANVGIAMGIAGTDVCKMASDMILTDDNFATITNALEEGRNIFNNIKKSLVFLLSCNVGEIILILLGNFLGIFFFGCDFKILTALQILWINLVTDSLPAMALGIEPQETNSMSPKTYNPKGSLLNKKTYQKIILEGFLIGLLAFVASLIGYYNHDSDKIRYAQTFAFMVLAFSQLIHVWNLRSFCTSVFKLKINSFLIKAFAISVFLQLIIIFVPFLRDLFQLISLTTKDFVIILLLSLLPLLFVEIKKRFCHCKCHKCR